MPAVLSLLALASWFVYSSAADAASGSCKPSLPSVAGEGNRGWFGTETLEALIPKDGVWRGTGPVYQYRDKLFWRSPGLRPGLEPDLVVTGRRLDGYSEPASFSPVTNAHTESLGGWTLLVSAAFPTPGCWEVTGQYVGYSLSFVVEVPPPEETHHCVDEGWNADCTLNGDWIIRSVDTERLLLAVNSQGSDAGLDHLFLLTGSPLHFALPQEGQGLLRFDPTRPAIRAEDGDSSATIIELSDLSVSHYWGYGDARPRLDELRSIRRSGVCEHVPDSCWETESGWPIHFPH